MYLNILILELVLRLCECYGLLSLLANYAG